MLWLGVPFGLMFVFVMAPFQVADESRHFLRVWHIAQGDLVASYDGGEAGGVLPADVIRTAGSFEDLPHTTIRVTKARILDRLVDKPSDQPPRRVALAASSYTPVSYLPQLPGVMLARHLHKTPLEALYFGRFTGLLVFLFIVSVVLRVLPFFQRSFLLLALMPMTLSEAAGISSDGALISATFLFIALVLRAAFSPSPSAVSWRMVAALAVLSAVIALCKPIYLVVNLLLFLIPARKAGGWPRLLVIVAVVGLVSTGAALAWAGVSYLRFLLLPGAVSTQQLGRVAGSPSRFVVTALASYVREAHLLVESFVGNLGWMDAPLPRPLVAGYVVLLIVVPLVEVERPPLRWWHRLVLAATVVSAMLVIAVAMFLYSPTNKGEVGGMQGRYFIPIAPLVLLSLSSGWAASPWSENRRNLLVAAACALTLSVAGLTAYHRYFGP